MVDPIASTFMVEVKGDTYEVSVDSEGMFWARDANDNRVKADTLAAVKKKLAAATVRVSVPYTKFIRGWGKNVKLVDGEFTGLHSDGRHVLARENGKAVQTPGYDKFLRRLTDAERAELLRLVEAEAAAKEAVEKFTDERAMRDVRAVVQDAMKQVTP
jgi:hypothetical protein